MNKIYLIILTLIVSLNIYAKKEPIILGTFAISKFVESDSKGEFIKLTKMLAKLSGREVIIKVYPPKRTVKMFREKKLDGYFPALDILNTGFETYNTEKFYVKKDYLFAKNNDAFKNLTGKTLCLTSGYPYNINIIKKHKFIIQEAASDEACIKMLKMARVDLFMCEALTGLAAMKSTDIMDLVISKNAYHKESVFYSFHKDENGKMLRDIFSKNLLSLRNSGELIKLFSAAKRQAKDKLKINYDPIN